MFDDKGAMRIPMAKVLLKQQLKVVASLRLVPKPEAIVIDGSVILSVVHWPTKGKSKTMLTTFAATFWIRHSFQTCI